MTFKKILLPIVALAAILPVAMLSMNMSTDTQFELVRKTINPHTTNESNIIGKTLTVHTTDEDELNFHQLIDSADFIIEGKLLEPYVFEVKLYGSKYSDIFTNYQVEIINVLKGEIDKKVIPVSMWGGETYDRLYETEGQKIGLNDTVILFLEKDCTFYTEKNTYNLISITQASFLKEGDCQICYI